MIQCFASGCSKRWQAAFEMNRLLIGLGTVLVLAGMAWPWLRKMNLFHLPGDVVIDRPGFKFFFPLTTMLIISIILSLIAWLMRR